MQRGFAQVDIATSIGRYLNWIRAQTDIRDYFSEAEKILRNKGIVQKVTGRDAPMSA